MIRITGVILIWKNKKKKERESFKMVWSGVTMNN